MSFRRPDPGAPPPAVLDNEIVRFVLRSGGRVTSLENVSTGVSYVSNPDTVPCLIRLILPVPGWDGHFLELPPDAEAKRVQVSGDCGLLISTDSMRSSLGEFRVSVTIRIFLGGGELRLGVQIRNRSEYRLTEVQFPRIGGLVSLTADPYDTALLVPGFFEGEMIRDPVSCLDSRNAWLTSSPGGGRRLWFYPRIMQWADYFGADEGLYFGLEDPHLRVKAFLAERERRSDDSFVVSWVHYPHLAPKTSCTYDTFRMVVHAGDWHAGADLYRKWCAGFRREREVPPDVRESIGWHFVFLRHGDGRIVRRYAELPELFEAAREAGLNTLQVFGFHDAGMDRGYPDYRPSEALGGEEELRSALDSITGQGGRVALYQAGSAANLFCGEFSARIAEWALRTGRGETVRRDWTWTESDTNPWIRAEPFVLMCYGSGWKNQVAETTARYLARYGATAVHLDHIGDMDFLPCYAENHDHDSPERAPEAIDELFASVRAEVDRSRATLHCEGMSEVSLPWVDIHWGQNMLLRHPEVVRYTFPRSLMCTTVQEKQYDQAARAFVLGLLFDVVVDLGTGSIDRYPEFAAYLRSLATLRRELKEYLVYGTFVDTRGIRRAEGVYARSYLAAGASRAEDAAVGEVCDAGAGAGAGAAVAVQFDAAERPGRALSVDWSVLGICGPVEATLYAPDAPPRRVDPERALSDASGASPVVVVARPRSEGNP